MDGRAGELSNFSERHKVNSDCGLNRVGAHLFVEAGVVKAHAEVPCRRAAEVLCLRGQGLPCAVLAEDTELHHSYTRGLSTQCGARRASAERCEACGCVVCRVWVFGVCRLRAVLLLVPVTTSGGGHASSCLLLEVTRHCHTKRAEGLKASSGRGERNGRRGSTEK